jgi:hypothetical protein
MHPPNDKTKLAESNWEISKQKSPEIKNAQQLLNSYQFSNLLYLQLQNYPIDTAHPQHFLILSFPKPFRWIRMTPPSMPQNHAKKGIVFLLQKYIIPAQGDKSLVRSSHFKQV